MKQMSNKLIKYNFQGRPWDQEGTRPKTGAYQVKKALHSNKTDLDRKKIIDALFVDQDAFENNQYLLNQDFNEP